MLILNETLIYAAPAVDGLRVQTHLKSDTLDAVSSGNILCLPPRPRHLTRRRGEIHRACQDWRLSERLGDNSLELMTPVTTGYGGAGAARRLCRQQPAGFPGTILWATA